MSYIIYQLIVYNVLSCINSSQERAYSDYATALRKAAWYVESPNIPLRYDYKFTSGRLDGKPGGLAPKSIKNHSLVIKEALDDALVNEIILRNVASKVPIPKQVKRRKETFLNAEEANEVLKLFTGHKLQPLIYITLYYGLRRSKVLGLKWTAIDFKKDRIKINHTVVKHTSTVTKDKTKTEASRREYTLFPEIKEILLKIKAEQKSYKKLFGKEYQNTDYVFTWPDGRLYQPNYVTKEFQKVLAKNNFPKMRFHDLRQRRINRKKESRR